MIQKAKAMEKLDTDDVSFYFYYPHYISTHHTTASHCITITVYQHHHIITLYPYHHSVSISPLCIHIITVYPHTHTHTHTHSPSGVQRWGGVSSSGTRRCSHRSARTSHAHAPRWSSSRRWAWWWTPPSLSFTLSFCPFPHSFIHLFILSLVYSFSLSIRSLSLSLSLLVLFLCFVFAKA